MTLFCLKDGEWTERAWVLDDIVRLLNSSVASYPKLHVIPNNEPPAICLLFKLHLMLLSTTYSPLKPMIQFLAGFFGKTYVRDMIKNRIVI